MKRNLDTARVTTIPEKPTFLDNKDISLSLNKSVAIARQKRISLRAVEVQALRNQIVPERYSRNIQAIGIEGQIKLLSSQIAIVGVGGLGGDVAELAARLGIGTIVVVDGDRFADGNLNRQLLSHSNNIGKSKVLEARRRIKQVNPAVTVGVFDFVANKMNISGIIRDSHVVVDGLDDIRTRFIVEKACKKFRIPFIHAAVAGFAGQVTTIFPEDAGLKRIYGSQSIPKNGCEKELGVVCITPALAAAIQVSEVIKILLGWTNTLQDKVMFFDLKELFMQTISLL
jgi:molybdopterin/thiamine biosynthesis adenylyltransferase